MAKLTSRSTGWKSTKYHSEVFDLQQDIEVDQLVHCEVKFTLVTVNLTYIRMLHYVESSIGSPSIVVKRINIVPKINRKGKCMQ